MELTSLFLGFSLIYWIIEAKTTVFFFSLLVFFFSGCWFFWFLVNEEVTLGRIEADLTFGESQSIGQGSSLGRCQVTLKKEGLLQLTALLLCEPNLTSFTGRKWIQSRCGRRWWWRGPGYIFTGCHGRISQASCSSMSLEFGVWFWLIGWLCNLLIT